MDKICLFCTEPVERAHDPVPVGGDWAHRECMLRMVLGGIGHLENHPYWCNTMHDPDGGRSYRQSALECDEWVHRHGMARSAEPWPNDHTET